MADTNELVFYDIAFREPRKTYSCAPNPWKARYTLNAKKAPYTSQFIDLLGISDLRKSLDIPASRTNADGSDYFTLPMVINKTTDEKIGDSFDIAIYLNKRYPDSGAGDLFPEQTLDFNYKFDMPGMPPLSDREGMDQGVFAEYAKFNKSVDAVFSMHVVLNGSNMRFNDDREKVIRGIFEARSGMSWDEMALRGQARTNVVASLQESLGPLAKLFQKDSSGPFVQGEKLTYADIIVGGWLRMMSVTLLDNEWGDLKKWHDGVFGNLHDALQQYADIE